MMLREEWLYTKIININLKSVDDFSLSQKLDLIYK